MLGDDGPRVQPQRDPIMPSGFLEIAALSPQTAKIDMTLCAGGLEPSSILVVPSGAVEVPSLLQDPTDQ